MTTQEPALEAAAAPRPHTRFDRFVLRATAWFADHTVIRFFAATIALALTLAPGIILLINSDLTENIEGFGYASVFLMNLASTATFFFPVPGLTAAAQALIVTEADSARFPALVGVAGGLGMAIGEITAYYAGMIGAQLVRGRDLPGPKRFHGVMEWAINNINWLMKRYGMVTLFVLSAIPNPFFEVAGLTAGTVRMPFRQFFVSVTAGKIVRGLLLAYFGDDVFDAFKSWLPFV
jgi:membrane protein DedA with SNARE-associated domain